MDELMLHDRERTPCEVWTRVMGYHRPVESFNVGKRTEHAERCYFSEHPVGQAVDRDRARHAKAIGR